MLSIPFIVSNIGPYRRRVRDPYHEILPDVPPPTPTPTVAMTISVAPYTAPVTAAFPSANGSSSNATAPPYNFWQERPSHERNESVPPSFHGPLQLRIVEGDARLQAEEAEDQKGRRRQQP